MHLIKKTALFSGVVSIVTVLSINFGCNNLSSNNPANSTTTSAETVDPGVANASDGSRLLSVANVYLTKNNTFEAWFFETPLVFEFSASGPNAKKYFDMLLKAKNNKSQKQVSVQVEKNTLNLIASISEPTTEQIAAFNKMEAARDKTIPTEIPNPMTNPAVNPKMSALSLTAVIPNTGVLSEIFGRLQTQCCISSNVLVTNDVFAVRTNSGNYAKVRITGPFDNSKNHGLPIQWVTYATNGSVVSSGSTVIPGTYTFDLDAGILTGANADIFWQQMTSTTRQVSCNSTATITNRGIVTFSSITVSQLQSYAYSTTPINGNDYGSYLYGQCVPFQYVADGCYARAQKMRQIVEDYYGYTSYKVFNYACDGYGTLAVSASLWGNNCCVRWWYHVTTWVYVQSGSSQVAYALDPAMFTAPVSLSTWIAAQKNTSCGYNGQAQGQVYYTSNAYVPSTLTNCVMVPTTDNGYTAANATCSNYANRSGCY